MTPPRLPINLPPTVLAQIPDGPEGIAQTLNAMVQFVRWGKTVPVIQTFAVVLVNHLPPKAWFAEVRTVFAYVRDEIRYVLDCNEIEVVRDPLLTLQLGAGDCDDKSVLLATLLECIGHPCRFLAIGFNPNDRHEYDHVIVQTRMAGEGRWLSLDATEPEPAGWFPPGIRTMMRRRI